MIVDLYNLILYSFYGQNCYGYRSGHSLVKCVSLNSIGNEIYLDTE